MVNAIAITHNLAFAKRLLEELGNFNLNVKIGGINSTEIEVANSLRKMDFDFIFLDKSVAKIYNKLFTKEHKKIIITLGFNEFGHLIKPSELKVIRNMINATDLEKRRLRIVQELESIGYKFKYKGSHYLADTILLMFERQDSMVDNLQTHIYPIVAEKYNKTIINIKSSINKATECMYCECNTKTLENYFHFSSDIKPTVKQVIFTVINKI